MMRDVFYPLSSAQYACKTPPCLTVSPQGWIVGEVRTFAFSADSKQPLMQELMGNGWVECAGQPLPRAAFTKLFKAIGDTWGSGDGKTDFYLPDLRGQTLRGWDHDGSQQQAAAFGGDPDFKTRSAPRPEIAKPGTQGNTGDNVGSIEPGLVGDHTHTTAQYSYENMHNVELGNGMYMIVNQKDKSFVIGPVTGSPKENRVNNVYVMYAIYVGVPVTVNSATHKLVRRPSTTPSTKQ
jgi:hypothetical protein